MTGFRVRFLPAFFTTLAIAFAVAVFFRIRAHSATDGQPQLAAGEELAAPAVATHTTASAAASEPPPIVEVEWTETDTASTRAAALREQRYRELLNTPPATAAPAEPQPKQSAIAKILAPVVNAFTGGSPKPQPPQAQREPRSVPREVQPQAMPQQQAQLPQPGTPGQSIAEAPKDPRKADPNDPTSDTTPPQLLSIEFTPPVVRDGEEIVLIISAQDQLSGIRSISGNVASPAGALQGFALQKQAEGRYATQITIPKDAAEGMWRINYLSMSDNAGNMVTLNTATGLPPSATFRVTSSRPDSAPPVLKALWIDKAAMRGGERNQVFIQAEDDKSGVSLVAGVFLSPSKNARLGFGCRGGTPQEGTWTCDFNPPANADCGDWTLEQVQLQDRANNMTAIRQENSLVAAARINISSDQCDSEPPTLQQVMLDPREVSNVDASVVRVTVTAVDDRSGISNVSGHVAGPMTEGAQPPRFYFSLSPSGDGRTWSGTVTIAKLAPKGTWIIGAIQLLDKANNIKIIGQNDPLLQGVTFSVR